MIRFIYLQSESTFMIRILLITFVILAVAIVLLGVKVLFVKGGKFPSGHAGDSPALRKKGIGCAADDK